MPRLRLLALVFLLGAAPPPPRPAPVEEAKAFLAVSCAAAKESCPQATALLADYLALLDDALDCMSGGCKLDKINALFDRDRTLDGREHLLPPLARSADSKRPFLRLSLFVITAAGIALERTDPKAKPPAHTNDAVEASKVVEKICGLAVGDGCARARGLVVQVDGLISDAAACETKPCPFARQETMAISAEKALGSYFALTGRTSYDTVAIFGMLRGARVRIARLLARTTAGQIARLEAADKALLDGIEKLEKDPGGPDLGGRIDALRARESAALKLYKDASITSDRTQSMLTGDPEKVPTRARINASAARLAAARGRLIALRTARNLGTAAGDAPGVVRAVFTEAGKAALGLAVLGGLPPAAKAHGPRAGPRVTPIDRRAVPVAPPAHPSAPPIIKGSPRFLALVGKARSKDPLIKADALRRLGFTSTLGDPSGRAPLLHPQKGADTCAIVAQQQILMAHGLIPKTDPFKHEALLAQEAKDRGFYLSDAGTPRAYQADLLVDRGLIVVKQVAAPIATLDAAVRRGGMIIASVDARHLWGVKSPKTLGHAIVITGAEVGRLDGRTLGYYINDSGVRSGGAGRFVPIEQFKKAWNSYTKSFSEVR